MLYMLAMGWYIHGMNFMHLVESTLHKHTLGHTSGLGSPKNTSQPRPWQEHQPGLTYYTGTRGLV